MGIHLDRSAAEGVYDLGYVLMKEYAGKGVVGLCVEALTRFWEAWGAEEVRVVKWQAYGRFESPSFSRVTGDRVRNTRTKR
jgi:hypothetical protein